MKSIRVGNDIVVRWRIYRYGKEYDVEQNKESISVILANMGEKKVITDYSVVDVNIIVFKFRAEDQGLGIYRLLLVDKSRNSTRIIEECNAFRIVSTANAADDEDTLESTVTITLTSELTAPADGLSAYEVALQNGFVGTEEEWLQSLLPDMTDIEQAEAQRQAKELERIASEEARESAESERQRASAASVASANDAAASANAAASAANKAAVNANNKASLADEATYWAQMQGDAALDASLSAEKQALAAKKAADNANAAAENANTKAEEANNAAISANAAKETANAAAGRANDAAANAEQKATLATEAASSASAAAEAAGTAAGRANEAADKFSTTVVQQQGTAIDKVISQKAVTDALEGKQEKEAGKGLSSNDYTDTDKAKLADLENYDDTGIKELINKKANDADLAEVAKTGLYSDVLNAPKVASSLGDGQNTVLSQDFLSGIINRLYRLLGYNSSSSVVNLELGLAGKYVKCESRSAVANPSFAISKPFAVDACSELLIKTGFNPSDTAHKGLDLTVIAIYEEIERQRTVQKKDASGNPLYYTVTVDESGNETVTTDETTENTGYPVYVMETYTEARYLPNNEERFVEIPDSGYYVANIPQSCKLVISYKPGVSDTAVIVEKHGAIANLISQVFGIYEHRTMVEAMVSLAARVDALEARQGLLGNATAGSLDVSELTKCLYPVILRGHGVPAATTIPENLPEGLPWDGVPVFIGQLYINLDAASGGLYYAVGHDSVSDWKQA